jgi:hypothetical protein
VPGQAGKINKTLSKKKKKTIKRTGEIVPEVECLPSKCEALGSIPSTAKFIHTCILG